MSAKPLCVCLFVALAGGCSLNFHGTIYRAVNAGPVNAGKAGLLDEIAQLHDIDRLPAFRDGGPMDQVSSYDRSGGNDDGFSGKNSFIRKEGDKLVIAELTGPGVIHRIWTPTPTTDTIEFFFDGETHPRLSLPFIDLFGKHAPFTPPLASHEVGGYYSYIPITYEKSCKVVFSGKVMQFIQIQHRALPADTPVKTFAPGDYEKPEIKRALEVAAKAWSLESTDLAATPGEKIRKQAVIAPGGTVELARFRNGGRINGIRLGPASAFTGDLKNCIIRMKWDGEAVWAVEAPVADFFGYSFGEPAMRSLLGGVDDGVAYCRLPMPFAKSAVVELVRPGGAGGKDATALHVDADITFEPRPLDPKREGRLYAQWRRTQPPAGTPYLILDAEARGHQVGTLLQAQGLEKGMTSFFEGDDMFTIDGELRIHGTGSEDAFNGGWYALPDRWDETKSLPVHGCLTYSIPLARTGAYRWFITDKVSFNKTLRSEIEHGGNKNSVPVDYTSVAFYYADRPGAKQPAIEPGQLAILQPQELEYWLELLPIRALSGGATVSYGGWRDPASKRHFETYSLTPGGNEGFMKIELEAAQAGRYEVLITYLEGPNAGIFHVDQRQEPLSGDIDAYAAEKRAVEGESIGEVNFVKGRNTLTFHVDAKNAAAGGQEFSLHRILLKRVK